MVIEISDDFDLDKTAESGQCFRWEKTDPDTYRIAAGDFCLYITDLKNGRFELDCTEKEFCDFWYDYFDLNENYSRIRARIRREKDPFLWTASESEQGIRILRQDPWEMLITFIISQNRNIPSIRRSVELLAAGCSEERVDSRGKTFYAFPSPEQVLSLSQNELIDCRLGYRCKYVHAAADAVCKGSFLPERLMDTDEKDTIKALTGLYGVGIKVANCVSLFGLHHLNAFPEDVWMKRILNQEYPDGYPFAEYAPYNGVYQQYMFAYYRHLNSF